MKKTVLLIIVVAIVLVAAYFAFAWAKKQMTLPAGEGTPAAASSTQTIQSVGQKIGSGNPFDAKVNPYQGYTNPFAK